VLGFVLRRLLVAVPTFIAIVAVAFVLMRSAQGGPFDSARTLPPEIELRLKAAYDLDQPVLTQFMRYTGVAKLTQDIGLGPTFGMEGEMRPGLLQGNLGPSMKYKDKSVADILAEGFPVSAAIGFSAMLLALGVGMSVGVFAALRQNKPADWGLMSLAIIGICVPTFVMAPLLSLFFGVQLGWLPTAGLARGSITPLYLILPVVTLALYQIAVISRMMRASTIETLRSNYVRTARAKGLNGLDVIWRHVLPAASLPLVSYLGPAIAGLLTGSFIVETTFQLPGIGRQFITGALTRDYTVVMGVIIVYAGFILLMNLLADVIYGVLDPKVRQGMR
jgi:oligopeptide transport system permease protein